MLSVMRNKLGPSIVGAIVLGIAVVFMFEFGVNKGPSDRGGNTFAGTVNGEPITLGEFNREYNRRLEFFKQLGGGQISDEMIEKYHIKESVFRDLASRKVMVQEAEKVGVLPSDTEVRQEIVEIPAFKKDGRFDRQQYRQVLEANNYTMAGFEKMVRDDLISQHWREHFRNLVRFSEAEVQREFVLSNDKRKIRYALITLDAGRKRLKITDDDVTKFLADKSKTNLAQARYDQGKAGPYKGKTFDQVKDGIARELVGDEKTADARKIDSELADAVVKVLTTDAKSDSAVNAILKGTDVKLEASPMMARGNFYLPGAGDIQPLEADAFSGQLDSAKKYEVASGVLVAVGAGRESADVSKLDDQQREDMIGKILSRKENELYSEWMKKLMERAKIVQGEAIAAAKEGA